MLHKKYNGETKYPSSNTWTYFCLQKWISRYAEDTLFTRTSLKMENKLRIKYVFQMIQMQDTFQRAFLKDSRVLQELILLMAFPLGMSSERYFDKPCTLRKGVKIIIPFKGELKLSIMRSLTLTASSLWLRFVAAIETVLFRHETCVWTCFDSLSSALVRVKCFKRSLRVWNLSRSWMSSPCLTIAT